MSLASPQRWGEEVVRGTYAGHEGLLYEPRPRSIVGLLDECGRFGERIFLVQGDQRVSFDTFRRSAPAAADVLRAHGVVPGDRVLLLAYNSPAWVLAFWSAWVAGAVPVLGNRWWSAEELAVAAATAGTSLVVTDAPDLVSGSGLVAIPMSSIAECFDPAAPEPALVDLEPADEDDEAMLLFTSGSSGRPKAVRLSHRAVIANQHNLLFRSRRLPHQQTADAPQAVSLVSSPLFHIGGVASMITQVIAGGRLVFLKGRFDPGEVLALIQAEGVTSWGGVPTMAARVLEHPAFESFDLSSLRNFPLGGAPVPDVLLERLRRQLPHLSKGLANTWGLSESGGFLTLATAKDIEAHQGTVGKPHPVVEVRVGDPDADGVGELLVRSPSVMLGYVGLDDGTVDAEGWLHTGDVGRVHDGLVFITGRSKDVVIRGGENIACPHVEEVLLRHPDVVEAAVMGIPHPDLGEELVATVVVRPASGLGVAGLRAHAEGALAYFEIPTRWIVRTEALPVLATGKMDKQALRAEHLAGRPA